MESYRDRATDSVDEAASFVGVRTKLAASSTGMRPCTSASGRALADEVGEFDLLEVAPHEVGGLRADVVDLLVQGGVVRVVEGGEGVDGALVAGLDDLEDGDIARRAGEP